jgi:hypothetical protein
MSRSRMVAAAVVAELPSDAHVGDPIHYDGRFQVWTGTAWVMVRCYSGDAYTPDFDLRFRRQLDNEEALRFRGPVE